MIGYVEATLPPIKEVNSIKYKWRRRNFHLAAWWSHIYWAQTSLQCTENEPNAQKQIIGTILQLHCIFMA